jgi:glycosyltransferase involved in cell wall biosynthesis
MITYKVVFYCPDQHIEYDLHTLDKIGVGGGITSRVRIAHALAKLGHQVTLFVNCQKNRTIQGVDYIHFSQMKNINADIFIAASSGGNLDLSLLKEHEIQAPIKIVMLQGVTLTKNLNFDEFNFFYVPSNFIRTFAISNWNLPPEKFFVCYRGVKEENFKTIFPIKRDPYQLVYLGHPIKGLETAKVVLRKLRRVNSNYSLHIFGGNRLWGGAEEQIPIEPGIRYHGLLGQKKLAQEIQKATFSLNLQDIREAFGMAVTESMRAGCIVLASPVGAFAEIIQNGYNGFLVSGDHTQEETREKATDLILRLTDNSRFEDFIRKNALRTPISWDIVAQTWEDHWNWILQSTSSPKKESRFENMCCSCKGDLLAFADGFHCTKCGNYQTAL